MEYRDSYNQWEAVSLTTDQGRDSYNQWKATNPSQKDNGGKRMGFLYYLLIIFNLFTHPLRGAWESRTPEPAIQIETIVLIFETFKLPV
jgi:hypothetical protein